MPKIIFRPAPTPPPFVPPTPPITELVKIYIKQESWQQSEEVQIKPTAINLENIYSAMILKTNPSSGPIEITQIDQESFEEGVFYIDTMRNAGSISDEFIAEVTFTDSTTVTVPAMFQLEV